MSLDLFACHAVHQAVLQGDVDAEAGLVLSILPKNIQESSLNQLKQLPSMATASQLVSALEFKAVNLSKADFDKSNCQNCLHNSSIANEHLKNHEIELKPHHCLFALCAQHDALDVELLSQRTVVDECEAIHEAPEAVSVINEQDLFNDAQMDLGVPDTGSESFCEEPHLLEARKIDAFEPRSVSTASADNTSAPNDAQHSDEVDPED